MAECVCVCVTERERGLQGPAVKIRAGSCWGEERDVALPVNWGGGFVLTE